MPLNSLEDLLIEKLQDIHSAEEQLVEALPEMARAASHPHLQRALQKHSEQTHVHVQRLEKVMMSLDARPAGKRSKAMNSLIEEGEEFFKKAGKDSVKDIALICSAQKVEHFEISAYGSARALARLLGREEMAAVLTETLDEESKADADLTAIAHTIHSQALVGHHF